MHLLFVSSVGQRHVLHGDLVPPGARARLRSGGVARRGLQRRAELIVAVAQALRLCAQFPHARLQRRQRVARLFRRLPRACLRAYHLLLQPRLLALRLLRPSLRTARALLDDNTMFIMMYLFA